MATTERGLLHQMHSSQVYLREFRELNALKTRLSESDLVDEELQRQLPGCENMDAICKVFSRSIQGSEELLYLLNETAEFDSLAQTFGRRRKPVFVGDIYARAQGKMQLEIYELRWLFSSGQHRPRDLPEGIPKAIDEDAEVSYEQFVRLKLRLARMAGIDPKIKEAFNYCRHMSDLCQLFSSADVRSLGVFLGQLNARRGDFYLLANHLRPYYARNFVHADIRRYARLFQPSVALFEFQFEALKATLSGSEFINHDIRGMLPLCKDMFQLCKLFSGVSSVTAEGFRFLLSQLNDEQSFGILAKKIKSAAGPLISEDIHRCSVSVRLPVELDEFLHYKQFEWLKGRFAIYGVIDRDVREAFGYCADIQQLCRFCLSAGPESFGVLLGQLNRPREFGVLAKRMRPSEGEITLADLQRVCADIGVTELPGELYRVLYVKQFKKLKAELAPLLYSQAGAEETAKAIPFCNDLPELCRLLSFKGGKKAAEQDYLAELARILQNPDFDLLARGVGASPQVQVEVGLLSVCAGSSQYSAELGLERVVVGLKQEVASPVDAFLRNSITAFEKYGNSQVEASSWSLDTKANQDSRRQFAKDQAAHFSGILLSFEQFSGSPEEIESQKLAAVRDISKTKDNPIIKAAKAQHSRTFGLTGGLKAAIEAFKGNCQDLDQSKKVRELPTSDRDSRSSSTSSFQTTRMMQVVSEQSDHHQLISAPEEVDRGL
ncbi:hypothetical protein AVI51_07180 [Piscirickettsia salmonis]|uniref:Uncharacterized protein n=2 Tax=Piscirickettsia salmonis TaxID=1238 RepID=A0A9Q5V7I6_PISSA|nr:hypothetical protein [Piscirickettsia salmonis]ALA25856.1 DEAD/DEAH box helicase [Piscirickettsia salmonis]APS46682.1 hypothetical protein AVI49_02980 [Piscirickettsia salmonis]APS50658.1 hypothetical protein AVI50_07265 [Piscirickettsia salmonis]APS53863.1 hypothetical protein AVI51_07180 [Piscirickettsia salmonis]APS56928.1 hypothetical protein AVI52_06505 [Piscirickettsia salmonis]